MDKERALEYWINRYNYAKDYTDIHWDAEERHEHRDYVDAMAWAIKAIEQYADVQPVKRGRWYHINNEGFIYCSECQNEAYWDTDYGQQLFDYCPYCGAKMIKP